MSGLNKAPSGQELLNMNMSWETSDGLCSGRLMKTVVCIRNLFTLHYWPSKPSDFSEVGTTAWNHLTVSEALFLKTKPRLYALHFCEHCHECLHLDGQRYICKHWLRRLRLPALSVQHRWYMWTQTATGCYLCYFWRTQTDLDNTLMEKRGSE